MPEPLVVNHDTFDLIQACIDAMTRESDCWHIRELGPEYFSCTDEKRYWAELDTKAVSAAKPATDSDVCVAHFSNRGSALSWINHNAMAAAINTYLQRTAPATPPPPDDLPAS